MHAWVTGGAGFIGSHLVDVLVARGDSVAVVDDLSTGSRANLAAALAAGARLHECDVTEPGAFDGLPAPDVVFHLAAQIDVRRAVEDPAWDARVNVAGTAAALEAARAAGARRFVLASTGGAIYGEADTIPTPEAAAQRPLSPYGTAKAAAETYVELYSRLHGLSGMALRFANAYGPRQDPRLEGGVVAIFCDAARAGRSATIFGDGEQTRDFVHVEDIVAALLAAAGAIGVTEPCNISTGTETSVNALAAALGLTVEHAPERLGEVRRSCLEPARAAALLGWRAAVGLEEGLHRTRNAPDTNRD